ncbi:MAG: arylsulfatase [Verrucomicrobiales bacterium]|nr:arylsulfatase [Verrucomicrobiales bacterium]
MRSPQSLFVALAVLFTSVLHANERPNIIVILADDQGFGDVSALNAESKIPTPHIDRIAEEGMVFSDAHTSSAVCTPTRYSLLTGRYHWRTHLQKGVLGGYSQPLISPERLTVAGILHEAGYFTACIGKWHLGFDWPLKEGGYANDEGDFSGGFKDGWLVDYKTPIQNGPVDVGFDTFFGISASLDMPPYVYIQDRIPTEEATVEKAFHRPGPAGKSFEAVNVLPDITAKTVATIGERAAAAKDGTPFFIYFPLNAPHTPIVPSEEWLGKSGINIYADFTMQVDHCVGEVLAALDEHELAEDTLIIFTTDNGCSPQANFAELREAGHEPSYIYRGHKADIFEGGHRVPFIVRWPGRVSAGTTSDALVGQVDILATAAEITGAKVPEDQGEDSTSFLPILRGEADASPRSSIIAQSINGSFCIRDGNWKLILCPDSGGWSDPRPGRADSSALFPVQLYDLSNDPGEQLNLAEQHPDRVATMTRELQSMIDRGRTTPGPDLQNDVSVEMIKTPAKKVKKKA